MDGRIILKGIDSEGNRNAILDFKFDLESPLSEGLISRFEEAFYCAFGENNVCFECMAVYIPLRVGFYWDCIQDLVNPREFFISKCECLSNSN
jgi:hypothetical protein